MQQYLTLEEAAKMLQLSADDLREMARKKTIRAFQDRGSWRFRLQDMQEEARKRGINSDPEVQLGEGQKHLEDDEVPLGREKRSSGPRSSRTKSPPPSPKPGSDSDVRLVLDEDVQLSIDLDSDRKKVDLAGPKSSRGNAPKNPKRQSRLDGTDSGVRLVGGPNDPSDSDVKVVPSGKDSGVERREPNDPSDSDIRLGDLPSSDKKKGREANVITEEIDLDAEEARLAEKAKKKGKDGGKKQPTMMKGNSPLPTQSPFEISEPDFDLDRPSGKVPKPKKKSEVDSSSDFELIPFDASKSPDVPVLDDDDVDLGGHVGGGRAGNSGINLDHPKDGGISLESGGSDEMEFELTLDEDAPSKSSKKIAKAEDDSSSEFELSLDDSSAEESAVEDVNSSSEFELSVDDSDEAGSSEFELSLDASDESSALVVADENSDSEFELTLDDDGGLAADDEDGKDIFEDTSFDVPALDDDSGSQAVAIDDADTDLEGSDFEISLDEDSSTDENAGSAIALDEDEEADEGAATVARAKKPAPKGKKGAALVPEESQVDLEIEDSTPAAKKGKKVATDEEADSDDDLERPAAAAPVASDWGAFPAVLLFPTVMVLFVVGLMGFELVRGMWGYHRPSPVGRPIIDAIARQVDDTLPK
jgi:excisionase family DNA binding protein